MSLRLILNTRLYRKELLRKRQYSSQNNKTLQPVWCRNYCNRTNSKFLGKRTHNKLIIKGQNSNKDLILALLATKKLTYLWTSPISLSRSLLKLSISNLISQIILPKFLQRSHKKTFHKLTQILNKRQTTTNKS
jgi:hypothetical protein